MFVPYGVVLLKQAASLKLVDIGSDMGVGLGDSDQPSLSGSMRGMVVR